MNWFMKPIDPRHTSCESREILGAVYASAAAAHLRAVKRGACKLAGEEPTAQETWAFMLNRAEACSLAWSVFFWSIYEEAIQTLQDPPSDREAATIFAVLLVH